MWWVIFNNPEFCVGGCGEDDFSNAAVNASVFFADGEVIGSNGLGNFSAQVGIGQLPSPNQVELGNGLFNPLTAEVWNVVRDHGPASSDPALLNAQLTTFNGGCTLTPRVDSFKLSTADFESINLTENSQVYLSLTKRVSHNN